MSYPKQTKKASNSWKRFIAAFDVHGDKQDPSANRVLFKFMEQWQPELRVMGGDLWDFRPLRRKASEDERRESMQADYKAGMVWLEKFKPTHFLRGNHDERLWELAKMDKGVESDYAIQGVAEITARIKQLDCVMLPYHKRDGILRLGHLKILHGFNTGVYAARQTALVYGSSLFGHAHAIDEHAIPGLERRVARMCGCLCLLDMDYNSRQVNTLRHAHGFAYGVINPKNGSYHVWQAENVNGKWVLPSDIVELS